MTGDFATRRQCRRRSALSVRFSETEPDTRRHCRRAAVGRACGAVFYRSCDIARTMRVSMAVQQNVDHIQTTHIGSLPRPHRLLDLLKAKFAGLDFDQAQFEKELAQSVVDVVRKQVECGIEIVTDGEFSKPGFFTYVQERLDGYEIGR